jgi:hypothetical protein
MSRMAAVPVSSGKGSVAFARARQWHLWEAARQVHPSDYRSRNASPAPCQGAQRSAVALYRFGSRAQPACGAAFVGMVLAVPDGFHRSSAASAARYRRSVSADRWRSACSDTYTWVRVFVRVSSLRVSPAIWPMPRRPAAAPSRSYRSNLQ